MQSVSVVAVMHVYVWVMLHLSNNLTASLEPILAHLRCLDIHCNRIQCKCLSRAICVFMAGGCFATTTLQLAVGCLAHRLAHRRAGEPRLPPGRALHCPAITRRLERGGDRAGAAQHDAYHPPGG
jgi:hypothetical protein